MWPRHIRLAAADVSLVYSVRPGWPRLCRTAPQTGWVPFRWIGGWVVRWIGGIGGQWPYLPSEIYWASRRCMPHNCRSGACGSGFFFIARGPCNCRIIISKFHLHSFTFRMCNATFARFGYPPALNWIRLDWISSRHRGAPSTKLDISSKSCGGGSATNGDLFVCWLARFLFTNGSKLWWAVVSGNLIHF